MCEIFYECCEICKSVHPEIHSINECAEFDGHLDFLNCPFVVIKVIDTCCVLCLEDLFHE